MRSLELSTSVTVESDSPWFTGHLPDEPILPGIAQLKMVLDLLSAEYSEQLYLHSLSRIKFRKIVQPGEELSLHVVNEKNDSTFSFRITNDGEIVCSGKFIFAQTDQKRIL